MKNGLSEWISVLKKLELLAADKKRKHMNIVSLCFLHWLSLNVSINTVLSVLQDSAPSYENSKFGHFRYFRSRCFGGTSSDETDERSLAGLD